ncbi:MAG: lipoyl(octanoyl) transferase LipB, partial [Gemmatimonadaceae bacterium]
MPDAGAASPSPSPSLSVVRLGIMPYGEALELQRAVAHARIAGDVAEDVLLLVEHPPVVTLGRTAKGRNLVASPEFLGQRGVELFEVERGGDVTFHGPGQLVGYPIIDLKRHRQDLHWYLRQVEEALIRALAEFGIPGERSAGFTGVWTRGGGGGGG